MIIAVDEDKRNLQLLKTILYEMNPGEAMECFSSADQALQFAMQVQCDVAFVEMKLRGMGGYLLAEKLKRTNPRMNLICMSATGEDADSAFRLRASGYQVKPVTREKIRMEMENLRFPV